MERSSNGLRVGDRGTDCFNRIAVAAGGGVDARADDGRDLREGEAAVDFEREHLPLGRRQSCHGCGQRIVGQFRRLRSEPPRLDTLPGDRINRPPVHVPSSPSPADCMPKHREDVGVEVGDPGEPVAGAGQFHEHVVYGVFGVWQGIGHGAGGVEEADGEPVVEGREGLRITGSQLFRERFGHPFLSAGLCRHSSRSREAGFFVCLHCWGGKISPPRPEAPILGVQRISIRIARSMALPQALPYC